MEPTPHALQQYRAALDVLAGLPKDILLLRPLSDSELLEATRIHTDASRLLGSAGAALAGELAHRSRPQLGGEGLARRTGHRTIDNLLKSTTGGSREQVTTVLAAGTLLVEEANAGTVDQATGEIFVPTQPWLQPLARAVAAGRVSTAGSKSIGNGLGIPNSAVTAEQLKVAVTGLIERAIAGADADQLFRLARDARNELDLTGVKLREEELRQNRSLRHFPLPSGGGRAIWDMDPESYAIFVAGFDRMVSPKLGGVRFVDSKSVALADGIRDDDRTPGQLASDGFIHLIVAGASADDSVLLGSGAPIIRITVAEAALESGVGLARIDGQPEPISLETAKRLMCTGDMIRVTVDAFGIPTESEAEQRLFSKRQREALAAKFGGCMDPDCDRRPSYCEAHHILQWARDGGKTVTDNGILLCKFHHLKYHNEGYEIVRDDEGQYWKIPPAAADPEQTPIHMPLKTRNLQDLATATLRTHVTPRAQTTDSLAGNVAGSLAPVG